MELLWSRRLEFTDTGRYLCTAVNSNGSSTATLDLLVRCECRSGGNSLNYDVLTCSANMCGIDIVDSCVYFNCSRQTGND